MPSYITTIYPSPSIQVSFSSVHITYWLLPSHLPISGESDGAIRDFHLDWYYPITRMRELRDGDSIEVQWVIDVTVESGRRKGQRNKKNVWWKGKVSGVQRLGDEYVALVRYDAGYGMGESSVSARFMRNKVQHKQDDGTLLCMQQSRYYKRDFSDCDDGSWSSDDDCSALWALCTKRNRFTTLSCHARTSSRVASLELRIDEMQRLLSAQSGIYSRLLRYKTASDVISDRAFSFLRHRMANACQRAIQLPKIRTAVSDVLTQEGRHIGMCFTRPMRADTDCTLAEIEQICRVVRTRTPTAAFYPTYDETQCPRSDIEIITILFDSIGCLGNALVSPVALIYSTSW